MLSRSLRTQRLNLPGGAPYLQEHLHLGAHSMSEIIKPGEAQTQEQLLADTEFGQKAKVTRHEVSNTVAQRGNIKLREIGTELIRPVNEGHETWRYQGSAAVHIYQSEHLGEIVFLTQTSTMQDVNEVTASKAFSNLKSDLQYMYSGKRQVKRSGF